MIYEVKKEPMDKIVALLHEAFVAGFDEGVHDALHNSEDTKKGLADYRASCWVEEVIERYKEIRNETK